MESLVSVVIPTHNRAELLMRAIKSVQAQSYRNLEIIVVSDGSTDNTGDKVQVAQKKDDRIRLIELKASQGGSAARNAGIDYSHGELIAFLDDDDEWSTEKIRKQVELINSNADIGLVYTGVNIIYVNEGVEYVSNGKEHGDLKRRILLDNCIGTTSSVLCRKSLLEEVGGFDRSLGALQDYDLWIRCCQKAAVELLPEPCVNYYNYTQNTQISSFIEKYEEAISIINNKYKNLFLDLASEEKNIKEKNELFLLFNKAMRNSFPAIARKYSIELIHRDFPLGIVAYLSTFFKYVTLLKFRKVLR